MYIRRIIEVQSNNVFLLRCYIALLWVNVYRITITTDNYEWLPIKAKVTQFVIHNQFPKVQDSIGAHKKDDIISERAGLCIHIVLN